ncbi:MAG: ATP-binding cassette domain-containing protein, partial [Muribaculaceae bacterium]|nr:ATP-binding cassette domain-containing protein [Muribaculaceae bacterium]
MSHHFLRFTDVHYTYPNGYEALKGVDFFISHGEKVALLGLNGAGKSTVLLHTNGLLLPTSGEVNVGGIPVTKKTLRTGRQSVGMVFQTAAD